MYVMRCLLAGVCLLAAGSVLGEEPQLSSENDKILYAIGLSVARNLAPYDLDEQQLHMLEAGLSDGVLGREPKVDVNAYQAKIHEFAQERLKAAAEVEKKASAEFLEKAAAEKGAVKTDSGLIYIEIKPGEGASPKATDTVKVDYRGTLRDGTVFDSSIDRGTPATFPLNRVIPCWTEGVQRMKVGGKSKLICPSRIAYGDRGSPPKIKPGAALAFEVELLAIQPAGAGKGDKPAGHP